MYTLSVVRGKGSLTIHVYGKRLLPKEALEKKREMVKVAEIT